MKRLLSLLSVLGALASVVVFPMLQVGCEEATGLDGLTISPSSVTLTTNLQVTTFSVSGLTNASDTLALPLTWSVSDASLGAITASSGASAIYQRTSVDGVNTVTARDQYDNEGYATVTSGAADYSLTLTAAPTSITVGGSSTITISDGGSAPYSWSLASGTGTLVGPAGSRSATFAGTTVGSATVQVTDANGASGTVGITVTDDTSVVIDPETGT